MISAVPPTSMIKNSIRLLQKIGVDKTIGASTATQMLRFITGPITMVALIRYMSPEEQGFYYSFAGVMGIQVFLEAGFGQSITQFSSKEFAKLRFNRNGLLTGDAASLSRLRSIFHKANRYYTLMAGMLTLALAVGGYWFFDAKESHGVPWQIPWLICSFCAGFGFVITPFWSVLEGCNRVAEVAVYRLCVTLTGFLTTIIALFMGCGIHVASVGAIVSTLFPVFYLFFKWRPFLYQIWRKHGDHQVSWKNEIWGFQWRIASVWMAKYGLEMATVPMAFHYFGPAVAGKLGFTVRLLSMGGMISTSWTSSKIPSWGSMLSSGKYDQVLKEWRLASIQHISISTLIQVFLIISIGALVHIFPSLSDRTIAASDAIGYSIGIIALGFWLVHSHLARAARIEPYTLLTICASLGHLGLVTMLPKYLGVGIITWSMCLVHIIAALFVVKGSRQLLVRINLYK